MTDTTLCLLCQQDSVMEHITCGVRDSTDHCIVRCPKCEHVQLTPIATDKELEAYYIEQTQRKEALGDIGLDTKRKHVASDTRRRAELVRSLIGLNGKHLDIGSGEGFLQEELHDIESTGIDICNDVGYPLSDHRFSVVSMFHVLEHVRDPKLFLRQHFAWVKKNGHLIVEVPNHNDHLIEEIEEYKAWHYQVAHIHYFTPKTLWATFTPSDIEYSSLILEGCQRYGLSNCLQWKQTGSHTIKTPRGPITLPIGFTPNDKESRRLDTKYRRDKERRMTCDTLVMIIQK